MDEPAEVNKARLAKALVRLPAAESAFNGATGELARAEVALEDGDLSGAEMVDRAILGLHSAELCLHQLREDLEGSHG